MRSPRFLWSLAAAAIVAGLRLWFVNIWGGDAPYLDDWNTTGWLHIHAGSAPANIPWAWLLEPHLEHRLATQRLYSLALAALNGGQWDVRVELCGSALLWGALAGVFVFCGQQDGLRGRFAPAWTGFVVGAQAIPHGWENLLWSFQVHFLFLVASSLLALRWLLGSRPFSLRWWFGMTAGAVACVSQAGGVAVFATAAALSLVACGRWRDRRTMRDAGAIAALTAATAIAALALPHAAAHDPIRAHDAATWLRALGHLLAWPWSGQVWCAAVLWLPGIAWAVRSLEETTPPSRALPWLGWLCWSLGLAALSAWARGEPLSLDLPPSRYTDVLVVGVLVNGWCVLQWAQDRGTARLPRVATGLWLAIVLAGFVRYTAELYERPSRATTTTPVSLQEFAASRQPHANAVRTYVRTNDSTVLMLAPPIYPVKEHLAEIIDRLRTAQRWPATLDPSVANANWPPLSRLARHAGSLAWLAIGWGLLCGAAAWRAGTHAPKPTA